MVVPMGWGHLTLNLAASVGLAKEFHMDPHPASRRRPPPARAPGPGASRHVRAAYEAALRAQDGGSGRGAGEARAKGSASYAKNAPATTRETKAGNNHNTKNGREF